MVQVVPTDPITWLLSRICAIIPGMMCIM